MIIARIFRIIFSIYAFLVFIALMFLLFPLVIIASFFGKVHGGNIIYKICTFWADAACFLWGIHHRNIYEEPHDTDHPVVFVFNHISYMDIPIILKSFRDQHIRVLGKSGMAKIPVFGFIYRKAAVLVDRSSAEARAKSVKQLIQFIHHNISVAIAPEGTFNMGNGPLKEFYDGAFRIAIETQTPLKPVVFLDTYDRLHHRSVFSLNPGRSRTVFLKEISVDGLTTADVNSLKQQTFDSMKNTLLKYNASWVK